MTEHNSIAIDVMTGDVSTSFEDIAASAPTASELISYAANARWRKETSGVYVSGMSIPTDDRSKLLLQGARTAADADPSHVEGWKTPDGWVDLTAAQIVSISNAVRAHVSACFAAERSVVAQIADGTIATYEQVEAAFAGMSA